MSEARTHTADLWAEVHHKLEAFLPLWCLRHRVPALEGAEQHTTTPTIREWLQVHALFRHWYETSEFPKDHVDYARRVAPLFCATWQEQQAFSTEWQEFFYGQDTVTSADTVAQTLEPTREETDPSRHVESSVAITQGNQWLQRLRWTAALCATLLVVGAGLWLSSAYWSLNVVHESPSHPPPEQTEDSSGEEGGSSNKPMRPIPRLTMVPLRDPAPTIHLSEEKVANFVSQTWWERLFWISLMVGVSWALYIWGARTIKFDQLQRWQKNLDSDAVKLSARHSGPVLPPKQRAKVGALRFHVAGSRVDWARSVVQTAQAGGFPRLRHRPRFRQTDCVVVCDVRHYRDQAAWLLIQMTEELKAAGLHITLYDFDRHPDVIWHRGAATDQAFSLIQLRHRHPDGRLLVLAESDMLFYRLTGELQQWVQDLKDWPTYSLGLLNEPTQARRAHLQQEGIHWRHIGSTSGRGGVVEALSRAHDAPLNSSADAITGDPDDFLSEAQLWSPDDHQQDAILANLEMAIHADGMCLLGGMAMYPVLRGQLTYALFRELGMSAETLFKVVKLPWCRHGWLPRWLRDALVDHLGRREGPTYERLHRFYLTLFFAEQKSDPGAQFDSGLQRLPHNWSYWLKWAMTWAKQGEGVRDVIFARVLLSPRWHPELRLPGRWLEKVLPRRVVERIPAQLTVVLIIPLVVSLCWALWMGVAQLPQVEEWLANDRLETIWQEHAQEVVTIHYHPDAETLVKPIAKGLQAVGFHVGWNKSDKVKDNRIDAPLDMGLDIARIAQYNSWGQEYPVYKAEESQLLIAKPLQSGQVFRDRPLEKVRKTETPYPKGYPEEVAWVEGNALVAATPQKASTPRRADPSLQPRMTRIPAGTFLMGSPEGEQGRYEDEGPQHEVTVPAFELGETEITFAEWDRCVEAGACKQVDDEGWGRANRPVITVSWNDAQAYIQWLNAQLGLSGAEAYRLPTEAEWEYAARSGERQEIWAGTSDQRQVGDFAVYVENSNGQTAEVKSKRPNAFGLYDMSGNAWEWVQDCYQDSYNGAPTDGTAWEAKEEAVCEGRSLRGGGWDNSPQFLRSASRFRVPPDVAISGFGFRLARTP